MNPHPSTYSTQDDIAVLHKFPSPMHSCLVPHTTTTMSPPQLHKVHLETSFAPSAASNGLPRFSHLGENGDTHSVASSNGGGALMGPTVSEATTIPLDELRSSNKKIVAFDTKREIITNSTKSKRRLVISPPLQVMPRGILQTSNTGAEALDRKRTKKPMSLSFTEVRSTRTISEDSTTNISRKVDLIHDDWLGLAPLASPESLSEISSISSRAASLGKLNLNSSIERVFLMASCQEEESAAPPSLVLEYDVEAAEDDLLIDDKEEMRTPVIMRRAIKIDNQLSNCGDNWAEVEKYKRHGKVFVSKPVEDADLVDDDTDSSDYGRPSFVGSLTMSRPNAQRVHQLIPNGGRKPFVEISCSSDSSSCASSVAGSFRTAQNEMENVLLIDFNSRSNEFLDVSENKRKLNASEEILGAGSTGPSGSDRQDSVTHRHTLKVMDEGSRKLTQSDSAILGDGDQKSGAPLKRIDVMRRDAKVTIINSSSDTYHSATSSYCSSTGAVFYKQEPITNKMASGVIESHFPVCFDLPPIQPPSVSSGSPLRSQVLLKSATDRLNASPRRGTPVRNSASSSPARGIRVPTVTIQYQQKPSPTHFTKSRKIYPAQNTSMSNSFGGEESNV